MEKDDSLPQEKIKSKKTNLKGNERCNIEDGKDIQPLRRNSKHKCKKTYTIVGIAERTQSIQGEDFYAPGYTDYYKMDTVGDKSRYINFI